MKKALDSNNINSQDIMITNALSPSAKSSGAGALAVFGGNLLLALAAVHLLIYAGSG